jgi:ABC-type lipoprotein release transport system permease subunit
MALVPLHYNLRSLWVRRGATFLTVCSVAATVAVLAGVLSLQQGFASIYAERGRTDLAVFLRLGADSEGESFFEGDRVATLAKETPEIALDAQGQPLASGELYLAVRRRKADGGETNVPIRGVQPPTFAIHGEDVRIVDGRNLKPGSDEVIVGAGLQQRLSDLRTGDVLQINVTPFRVVGVFEHKGGYRSEIWGDADRMMAALQRPGFSRMLARLKPGADVTALAARLKDDLRAPAKVEDERQYLTSQTGRLSTFLAVIGVVLALIMGTAAVFTGTNAMLSAIAARTHEIGILLATGFRPWAVFVSFLFEAAVLGLCGGVLGCLIVLPLQGMKTGTTNFQTFTEVAFAFSVSPLVMAVSVVFAVLLGLVGGAFPALRAARLRPTQALRRT